MLAISPFTKESNLIIGYYDTNEHKFIKVGTNEVRFWADTRAVTYDFTNPRVNIGPNEEKALQFEFMILDALEPKQYDMRLLVDGETVEIVKVDVK